MRTADDRSSPHGRGYASRDPPRSPATRATPEVRHGGRFRVRPHPDDAEIGARRDAAQDDGARSHATGIVDMTTGDMGWGTPEVALEEYAERGAASSSSTCARTSTSATAAIEDTFENRCKVRGDDPQAPRRRSCLAPYYNLPIGRGLGHNDHYKTGPDRAPTRTTSRTCARRRSRASRIQAQGDLLLLPPARARRRRSSSTSPTTSTTGSRRSTATRASSTIPTARGPRDMPQRARDCSSRSRATGAGRSA